jgi:aminomethyltransferase
MSHAAKKTALNAFHRSKNAKMVTYAGYDMPVAYPAGHLKEHFAARTAVGMFDVSHMGQAHVVGKDRERFMEWVTPVDFAAIPHKTGKLTFIPNENGGLHDDCIVHRYEDHLGIVVNAGNKEKDIAYFKDMMARFNGDVQLIEHHERSLLAIQGPQAADVVGGFVPGIDKMLFMHCWEGVKINGIDVSIVRCGYTGEDGFEISVPSSRAEELAELFSKDPRVQLAGLGARDTLRLEAALPLHGHELGPGITPLQAGLGWVVGWEKGDFRGRAALAAERDRGVARRLVGLTTEGRQPPRQGADVVAEGSVVGTVTSGNFSPMLGYGIALALVDSAVDATPGRVLGLDHRGRSRDAAVTPTPFVTAGEWADPA